MATDPSEKQTLDLTLRIICQFVEPVGGKVLLNHAISLALTGFDLNAQQSNKKMRVFWSEQKAKLQWLVHSP